jgi:transglutaminase-like putative cysteine protease
MERSIWCIIFICLILVAVCRGELYTAAGNLNTSGNLDLSTCCILAGSQQGVYALRTIFPIIHSQLTSPTYQTISNTSINCSPYEDVMIDVNDSNSNPCKYLVWGDTVTHYINYSPTDTVWFTMRQEGQMAMQLTLNGLCDGTPFPCSSYPDSVQKYRLPSRYIESDNPQLISFAQRNFRQSFAKQFQVVTRICEWARDNMNYYNGGNPDIDALQILADSLEPEFAMRRRTTCIGYAHLPIALLRAMGIPARYVAGVMLDGCTYLPKVSDSTYYCSSNASHAWIEVYYLDEGWVPYDAQLFVHFIDPIRYRVQQGHGYKDSHIELYAGYKAFTPGQDLDWVNLYCYREDNSQLDITSYPLRTTGNLILRNHSSETSRGTWIDQAYLIVPGDANCDSHVDVGDAIFIMNYCFKGGPAPSCGPNGDANGDCHIQVGDAVYIINYVFKGGPAPIYNSNCAWPVAHDNADEEMTK